MKPDQERIHTVLTDTISLLCRNGLNYDKELKVQGVIGVTLDNTEVFIVHINEIFDGTFQATTGQEMLDAGMDQCSPEVQLASKMTKRSFHRNFTADVSRNAASGQRSNRTTRVRSQETCRLPGSSQASMGLSLQSVEKSSNHFNSSDLESPVIPYALPGIQNDTYSSSEQIAGQDFPVSGTKTRLDKDQSKVMLIKDDDTNDKSYDIPENDQKNLTMKEDDEENVQHFNSITSSLQESNDEGQSEDELEHGGLMIDEQHIKVESDTFDGDSAADHSNLEMPYFGTGSKLPVYLPEASDSQGYGVDLKSESSGQVHSRLLPEDKEGPQLPHHLKHAVGTISPSQKTIEVVLTLQDQESLLIDRFHFTQDRRSALKDGSIRRYWKCARRNVRCNVRCTTTENPTQLVSDWPDASQHNHECEPNILKVRPIPAEHYVSNIMWSEASSTQDPPSVIVKRSLSPTVDPHLQSFRAMQETIRPKRQKLCQSNMASSKHWNGLNSPWRWESLNMGP